MKKIIIALAAAVLVSCGEKQTPAPTIYVSIAPLAHLVEHLADSSVQVKVLVPESTSPETYEPTTQQIQQLSEAQAYIHVGLIDFEKALSKSVSELSDNLKVLNLSEKLSVGLELIEGACNHAEGAAHAHGIDPHVWLSPVMMNDFVVHIKNLLNELYPEHKGVHCEKLHKLQLEIFKLDQWIRDAKPKDFVIYHPSLSYYAVDYGVQQIAIEQEGKEPSVSQLISIIENLKDRNVTKIFHQSNLSVGVVDAIASELQAEIIQFDPLEYNWIENLRRFTSMISHE